MLTFADAIERFGKKINQEGLGEAYRRAERAFAGQLEQHFVVLRNNHQGFSNLPHSSSKNEKKRPLIDQSEAYDRILNGGRARGAGRDGGAGSSRGNWRAKVARRGMN